MANAVAERTPMLSMQGILVPESSVNPEAFFAATRRNTFQQKGGTYAGLGQSDQIKVLEVGIISGLNIKFSGSLVVTLGGGTCATTARWPYDLIKAARLSANGQSNLINCSGWKLKQRDIMGRGDLSDRGVARGIGGASPGTSRTQGTLSLANEDWGVGQNVTAIPSATYAVELEWFVPVAFDQLNLLGAIFAQTSSTDLVLTLDWATSADLFVLTGAATAVLTGTFIVEGTSYSIPQAPNGDVIVPDLSVFHSVIQTRYTALQVGENEVRLSGQGVGRQLLRVWWQLWNGSTPAPLPINTTNFGRIGWRYGGNDTPEIFADGKSLSYMNERTFNSDLSTYAGVGVLDWCHENAFRDSIDEGAATELRLLVNVQAGVTLTSPALEYVQETAFAGAAGA
jgi:hypothetical protein